MIKEKNFRNITNFLKFIEELNSQQNNFIYRGHGKKEWLLSTTWNRYRSQFSDINMTETLSNFEKNLARGGIFPFQKEKSKYKWLELARHYGIPTPLIDFSYSPYVALFFACSEISNTFEKNYAVLYALDITNFSVALSNFFCEKYKINEVMFEKIRENFFSGKYVRFYDDNYWRELKRISDITNKDEQLQEMENSEIINFPIDNNDNIEYFPENELFFIPHPSSFNKRMIKQHGCFLYDTIEYKDYQVYESRNLEDLISKLNFDDIILYKLYFPYNFVSELLYKLDLMNINGISLYFDENGAVIDTKNMKNYNSSFDLNDSKIIKG